MQCFLLQDVCDCLYCLDENCLLELDSVSLYRLNSADLQAMLYFLARPDSPLQRHIYAFLTFLVSLDSNCFLQVYQYRPLMQQVLLHYTSEETAPGLRLKVALFWLQVVHKDDSHLTRALLQCNLVRHSLALAPTFCLDPMHGEVALLVLQMLHSLLKLLNSKDLHGLGLY